MNVLSVFRVTLLASVVACSAGACSSSNVAPDAGATAAQCNDDPFTCTAGQTCWTKDQTPTFACLNSGPGKRGEECQPLIGAPTCGDGLVCFQTQTGGKPGICSAYCDTTNTAHACGAAEVCTKATLGGAKFFYVCVGPAAATDAGTDAAVDAPAPDATAVDAAGE